MKDLEFKSQKDSIGSPIMCQEDIEYIKRVREYMDKVRQREDRQEQRKQFDTEVSGPLSQPSARVVLTETPFEHVPDFNPYKNDVWGKRKKV